jgi:DNA-binding FadR family transcriptional regulator
MARASFPFEDRVGDKIEERLLPGQHKSIWLRYATDTAISPDDLYDERRALTEEAARTAADRVKEEWT